MICVAVSFILDINCHCTIYQYSVRYVPSAYVFMLETPGCINDLHNFFYKQLLYKQQYSDLKNY